MAKDLPYKSIDEYIEQAPETTQEKLCQIRRIIKETAPEATEKISWGMPTFYLNGNLVHFAFGKKHIGFYPGEEGVAHFLPQLADYKTSKGAIQFPLDKPLPEKLIHDIVLFRKLQQQNK